MKDLSGGHSSVVFGYLPLLKYQRYIQNMTFTTFWRGLESRPLNRKSLQNTPNLPKYINYLTDTKPNQSYLGGEIPSLHL